MLVSTTLGGVAITYVLQERRARFALAQRIGGEVVGLLANAQMRPENPAHWHAALASLRQVAAQREMSEQALLKFYIGQGLRQDLARLFGDRVLTTTARVLARHLQSDEAVAAIMREIREEAVG